MTTSRPRAATVAGVALLLVWTAATWLRLRGRVSLHDSFIVGIALVFAWVATLRGRPALRRPAPRLAMAMLALLAVGTLTRLFSIDSFPPPHGQLWEEAQMGKIAQGSIEDDSLDHYFPLPNLIAEVGLRVWGYSLEALRAPFVITSIAAVPVFLLATRALGIGFFASVAASALFASSAYLSVAGRVALESHSPILTLCAALAAAFYALRAHTPFAYGLAGACGGLLMTEYTSYRLYPPLLLAMVAFAAYREAGRRSALKAGALYLGCAVAVMLPVLVVPDENPLYMLAEGMLRHRRDMSGTDPDWSAWASALGLRVRNSGLFVFTRGSANELLPISTGVVDFYTGVAGVLALGYCIARAPGSAAAGFLVVAVVSSVVLAGALTQNPARYRLTPLPPLYFLAIALAIDAARRRWPSRGAAILGGCAIAALCVVNLQLLYTAIDDPKVQIEFADRRLAVALEIARLQSGFDGVILLDTEETFMVEPNDYSFLYDRERVRTVADSADIAESDGILLVDADRAEEMRGLASVSSCSINQYVYGSYRVAFATCEVHGSASP